MAQEFSFAQTVRVTDASLGCGSHGNMIPAIFTVWSLVQCFRVVHTVVSVTECDAPIGLQQERHRRPLRIGTAQEELREQV